MVKLLIALIICLLFPTIIFSEDIFNKDLKLQKIEISGVLEKLPADGAHNQPVVYKIKTSDNLYVILPTKIENKDADLDKYIGKKMVAKGKGTVEVKKNEKGEEIKTSIFTQLDSVELAELKTKPTPGKSISLPKVLIIGDSISLGYTDPVKKNLDGIAEVSRPGTNCQHTGYGLEQIKGWLGDTKWDVIHFNFGIWDTHLLDANGNIVHPDPTTGDVHIRFTPEQYKENLTKIVKILKETGAKIIWANTTPIMIRTGAHFEVIPNNNKIAMEVMKANNIEIDDLYGFVLPHVKEWQSADQVHFTPIGYIKMAKQVSDSIQMVIQNKKGNKK